MQGIISITLHFFLQENIFMNELVFEFSGFVIYLISIIVGLLDILPLPKHVKLLQSEIL